MHSAADAATAVVAGLLPAHAVLKAAACHVHQQSWPCFPAEIFVQHPCVFSDCCFSFQLACCVQVLMSVSMVPVRLVNVDMYADECQHEVF